MRNYLFIVFTLQTFTLILTSYMEDRTSSLDLYNNVNEALYDEAVVRTKTIQNEGKSGIICFTVSKLLEFNVNTIINYAYKLWVAGEKQIVTECFPKAFKLIFNEDDVRITNRKLRLQLKLDVNEDKVGYRLAWGNGTDAETQRLLWRFEPVWEHNKVSFKIKNVEGNMFLKLMNDSFQFESNRLTWDLEPLWADAELFFGITNEDNALALELTEDTALYHDREGADPNGDDGKRFQWIIEEKNPDV